MASSYRCKICGEHVYRAPDSDDRCDDCINRAERLAEIEADPAPPEFKEGRIAYLRCISKWQNPYTVTNPMPNTLEVHENTAEMLWRQGWEVEERR